MCRAIWLLVVGSTDEACKALRRAAGVEAHVVAMTTDPAEALSLVEPSHADAVVIDARDGDAAATIGLLKAAAPGAALLAVGGSAPDADHVIEWTDDLADELPGAITRALINRRSR